MPDNSKLIDTVNRQLLIDGALVPAESGDRREVRSPADGTSLGDVAWASRGDVDLAVSAASRAFPAWRETDLMTRKRALDGLVVHLRDHVDDYGYLDAVDSGNPISAMRSDVNLAATFIDYISGLAFSWGGTTVPTMGRAIDFTVREPWGVTARIIPFNHPILFAAWKIAAPLLTGNTVVLKLPDQTPLSGLHLATALQELFPPGVVNVLTGSGPDAGDALVRHAAVARVAFIGSVATGRAIMRSASDRILPLTLELGGKNPMIVCPGADPDHAMEAAVRGMNFAWSQGQSCGSYSRLFVHSSMYDECMERLAVNVAGLRLGHPLDETTEMGALVDKRALERTMWYVDDACNAGASVLVGGQRPADDGLANGYYFEPTVLTGVTPSMKVAREEVFGPVQSVFRWEDEDQLFEEVNATEYGLTANVWTPDINRAMTMMRRIDCGSVAINGGGSQHYIGAPFGGFKCSGLGKEENLEEVVATTREKNVYIDLSRAST